MIRAYSDLANGMGWVSRSGGIRLRMPTRAGDDSTREREMAGEAEHQGDDPQLSSSDSTHHRRT